jgi:tungstate transport system ATP-binding protein
MHATASILPLTAKNLTYSVRGKALVEGLSLTLQRGGRTVILGPNGAGKTVTLMLLHGLLSPSSGTVTWHSEASGRRRHAMVFQHPVMLRRSARANLLHALAINGYGLRERRERADAALERFGLTRFATQSARRLSGGEKQRLALARAWALKPEVIFLDEPTSALDPGATRAIEEMILSLNADGVKLVMTTHDLAQARRLSDEVLFLHHGRLLEHTPAEEFFATPKSEAARAFLNGELLW